MAPRGLAILLGAGPAVGAGITRMLSSPAHGNLAVALLARNPDNLSSLVSSLKKSSSEPLVLQGFPTDVSDPERLRTTIKEIKAFKDFQGLKLEVAVYNVKHSHKVPFFEEDDQKFADSLSTYVRGAMVFGQECAKWMVSQYPASAEGQPMQKKGTIIFTGTLGALRTNAGYAAYGAGRSGVRMLAQSMARELSGEGVHVVHTVINGGVRDVREGESQGEDEEKAKQGKAIRAESVGRNYLWLSQQSVDCWVHELDLRPAAEKF